MDKAETLGELARDQVAQGHVVDQSDQPDISKRRLGADPLRDIPGDHADLRFHVAAPGFVAQGDRIAPSAQIVAAALIHQRIVPKALGQIGPACLAHQFDVVDVS